MINLNLELKKISVLKFSPKEKTVTIKLDYKCNKENSITKTIKLDNPELSAYNILQEIRKNEKNSRQSFDGESIIESTVNILIKDEEKSIQRITMFLCKVSDKISALRSSDATQYLNNLNHITSLRAEFSS